MACSFHRSFIIQATKLTQTNQLLIAQHQVRGIARLNLEVCSWLKLGYQVKVYTPWLTKSWLIPYVVWWKTPASFLPQDHSRVEEGLAWFGSLAIQTVPLSVSIEIPDQHSISLPLKPLWHSIRGFNTMITLCILLTYLFAFVLGFAAGVVALTKYQTHQLKRLNDEWSHQLAAFPTQTTPRSTAATRPSNQTQPSVCVLVRQERYALTRT